MMSEKDLQKKLGDATEKLICKKMRIFKYWSHILQKKVSGQPFDIFAWKGINNRIVCWGIDGKHVRGAEVSFSFDRIEPNQLTSFDYAHNFADIPNEYLGFAIFFERDKNLYRFSYTQFLELSKNNEKSVNMHNLKLFEEVLRNEDNN